MFDINNYKDENLEIYNKKGNYFITYNKKYLDFLGVSPFITGSDQDTSIHFRTSSFIGS